jgi:hypothetical protein
MATIQFSTFAARAAQSSGALRLSKKSGKPQLAARKGNAAARALDHLRALSAPGRAKAALRLQFLGATKLAYGSSVAGAVEQRLNQAKGPTLNGRQLLKLVTFAQQQATVEAVNRVFDDQDPVSACSVLAGLFPAFSRGESGRAMRKALMTPGDPSRTSVEAAFRTALKPVMASGQSLSDDRLQSAMTTALMSVMAANGSLSAALQAHVAANLSALTDATIDSLGCQRLLAEKRKNELLDPSSGFQASVLAEFTQLAQRRLQLEGPAAVTPEWLNATLLVAFRTAFYAHALQQPPMLASVLRSPVITFGDQTTSLIAELARGKLATRGDSAAVLKRFADVALAAAVDLWDQGPLGNTQPVITGQQQAARLLQTILETEAHQQLGLQGQATLRAMADKVRAAAQSVSA